MLCTPQETGQCSADVNVREKARLINKVRKLDVSDDQLCQLKSTKSRRRSETSESVSAGDPVWLRRLSEKAVAPQLLLDAIAEGA
jgi:hypothetical protein